MEIFNIFFIAVGLAMDCLAISLTLGIVSRNVRWKSFLIMAFLFGLFQGLMPLLGYLLGFYFKSYIEPYDHWFALVILSFLGIRMLKAAFSPNEKTDEEQAVLTFSSLMILALATSIDAFATGFIFVSMANRELLFSLLTIGGVSFVLSLGGSYVGARMGRKLRFNVEALGGFVLIAIGIKIFVEHLYFGY